MKPLSNKKFLVLILFGMLNLLPFISAGAAEPVAPAKPAEPVEQAAPEKPVESVIVAPTIIEALELEDRDVTPEQEVALFALGPADEFNRGVPRSTILALRKAVANKDYERAINYFDFRNLPFSIEEQGGKEGLIRKLRIIAKQTLMLNLTTLSTDPGGHTDDGLPSYRDRVAVVNTPNGPVELYLQLVPRGDGVSIWKVSNATVAKIPDLYEYYGYGKIGEAMADMFPVYYFLDMETWQWVAFLLLVIAAYILAWLITSLINIPIRHKGLNHTAKFVNGPMRFLVLVILVRASFDSISPSLAVRALFETGTMYIVAVTWVTMGIVDIFVGRLTDRLQRNGQLESKILLRPATSVMKIIIIIIAILAWLDNIGYEVTTLIAGLGVGSLAVALAAQKSLENIIGAVTIYASRTIRIGDFCRYKDVLGTIEEIGLRCTVFRTVDRTIVHIPNGVLANEKIENYSLRDKILYRTNIKLRYETRPDQLRLILIQLREMLCSHPMIIEDSSRVQFIDFGDAYLKIDIFTYIATTDYGEYLQVREDLNLRMIDIVIEAGSQLAMPANITYLARQHNLDEAKTQAAEEKVAQWRDSESLYMSAPPAEKREELKGTLDYPYKSTPTPK